MLVTHRQGQTISDYLDWLEGCAKAGVTAIQLREKNTSTETLISLGQALKDRLKPYQVPLIINDRLDLALAIGADGVHLGQSDGDPAMARCQLGEKAIIGQSIDRPEQIAVANHLPLDYVGIGSIFPTGSKTDVSQIWGIEQLAAATPKSRHPVIAIGGIQAADLPALQQAGAAGVAMISAIHQAENPTALIQDLLKEWK